MNLSSTCKSVLPSQEAGLEVVDVNSGLPGSAPDCMTADSFCTSMGNTGASADGSVKYLLGQIHADMNALLRKHVDCLQRDCEQRLGEHLKAIEHTLTQQQEHRQSWQQQYVQSSEALGESRRASSVVLSRHPVDNVSGLIDLPISTLRVAMLEESIRVGKAEAEEAALGSGFMGGGGPIMQILWGICGIFTISSGLNPTNSSLGADGAAYIATFILWSLSLGTVGICLCIRSYFLRIQKWGHAYLALTPAFAGFSINMAAFRILSIIMTLTNGCSWRSPNWLYHVYDASCVPMSLAEDCLALVVTVITSRVAFLLYSMRRQEASVFFLAFVSWECVYLLFTISCNVVYRTFHYDATISRSIQERLQGRLVTDCAYLVLFVFLWLWLLHKRRSARRRAWLLVKEDKDAYDEQWLGTMNRDKDVLINISALVREVKQGIQNYKASSGMIKATPTSSVGKMSTVVSCVVQNRVESVQRILLASNIDAGKIDTVQQLPQSLPFLYAQAFALNDHFQDKCSRWAASVGEHKPASVKKQGRAIQKLWRTYQGCPRLLTDLVRSSIICDTPSDVLTVLRRVQEDPDIGILRVKNRFDPMYDSLLSGGYLRSPQTHV